jgi:ABC-type sugar transport system ATPase subunit
VAEVALKMIDINKSFGGVSVLKDVSFEVRQGEVHALVGENGAGKSTLMKILMGVHHYDSGKYIVGDREVKFSSPADAQQQRVSMIYQEFELVQFLCVAENILLSRMSLRRGGLIDWPKVYKEAGAYLAMLGSNISPRAIVSSLPASGQQEVAIARALSYDPLVLVMDEPTSALSLGEVQYLFNRVRILRNRGVAIVYISHKLDEVLQIADRVTVLRDGLVVSTNDIKDIEAGKLIEQITGKQVSKSARVRSEAAARETSQSILELRNFNAGGLIYDINLSIGEKEIVGVAGLIGAGKSELARAICGALPKATRVTGKYIFDGQEVEIQSLNPNKAKKMGIGYVTENRLLEGMQPEQSMLFNVTLPNLSRVSRGFFINARAALAMALNVIKTVVLRPPDPKKVMKLFSGGNQQKVVIGRWLAAQAKLLILDEPTRGVDVGARQEIYNVIYEQARQGTGVLLLSSDLREVWEVADRILVMREGRIVYEALHHEISEERLLQLVFGQKETGEDN